MNPATGQLNSTFRDLAHGFFGIAAFGLLLLAPGYLWGRIADAGGFRNRSATEKFLWSVTLSLPLAIALCALAGRVLSPQALGCVFLVADVFAVALLLIDLRHEEASAKKPPSHSTRWMLALMAFFGVYCILAVTDIQVGHKLYVSTIIEDWSVRVSMVRAAMRSGVPPINGLSALGGHAASLRYFYFWYVLVADMARTFHLSAKAALAASCAWAGWALISACLLTLKYMLGVRDRLREKCFVGLAVGCVLGLDILPTALLWLSPKLHPYPEMEYWHQDRTPSFLGAVLYAPHHIAAFACLVTAFIVLLVTFQSEEQQGLSKTVAAVVFASTAFAASAGTSLFPTFCFVFVLLFWAVDLVRRRNWRAIAALVIAGLLSVAMAHGYLHELSAGSSAATGFASLCWRNDAFVMLQLARHPMATAHPWLQMVLRQAMILLLDFFDLGFYTLVIAHQVRRDLPRRERLTAGACAAWALVLGAAVPFFFLSSTVTSGPNDLGVDAGFLLRLGLQFWAVVWLWDVWQRRREARHGWPRAEFALAALLLCLGLSAQVYQAVSMRLYFALVGSGVVHKQMDTFTQDRLAQRFFNIRAALAEFDARTPPSAPDTEALQFNPVGAMLPAEVYYNTHQIAAWDTGCGTSYGGDYTACAPVYADLLFLFGNTQAGVDSGRAENDRQDGEAARVATATDFEAACRTLNLRAVVVESTDAIWNKHDSWVWTEPVIAANDSVRVLGCEKQ